MKTDREIMQQALEALELAKNSHGVLLLSDPPQDPWKTRRVDSALTQSITALRERLAQPEHKPDCALLKIPSRDCDCQQDHMPLFDDWDVRWNRCPPCNQDCGQGRKCPARRGA